MEKFSVISVVTAAAGFHNLFWSGFEPSLKWRYHLQNPIFIKINLSNLFIRIKFVVTKAELPCFLKLNTLFTSLSSMSHARNRAHPVWLRQAKNANMPQIQFCSCFERLKALRLTPTLRDSRNCYHRVLEIKF